MATKKSPPGRVAIKRVRKPARRVPAPIKFGGDKTSLVDQAIMRVGGSPIHLARIVSGLSGREVSKQSVNGWRDRRKFPRWVIVHIHKITGIPLVELILCSE